MQGQQDRARIVINDGQRVIDCDPGQPLLFALMANGIFLPSACGGRATCGQCKARVASETPAHNAEERGLIPESDRALGVHLSCQVTVAGEMRIRLPAGFLEARQVATRVTGIHDFGPDLREVTLDVEAAGGLPFRAGQYVQFILPGTEHDPRPIYRAYSLASSPSQPDRVRLLFGRVAQGACTGHVFDRLEEGDRVTVNGPFGEFYLREGSSPLLMVAGGTGIAPVRAILLDMAEKKIDRPVRLFYVARTAGEMAYRDDVRDLAARLPGFSAVLSLTHPVPGEPWDGEKGGMPSVLARHLPDARGQEAYLCGSPGMIDSSITVLRSRGIEERSIFFDKF